MPATHPGMEPSPGADPGLLPYRGRVTAVCDGRAPAQTMAGVPYGGGAASRARRRRCRARIRTLTPVAQNDVACQISRPGIECARRELNPHARRHRYLRPERLPVSPPALGAPPGI
jgi:hypothetical protein